MEFEENKVTLTQDTISQLAEMGVELDDCECDEEEETAEDEQETELETTDVEETLDTETEIKRAKELLQFT